MLSYSENWLEDLLGSKLDPLVNSQGAVTSRVILLQDGLILILNQ